MLRTTTKHKLTTFALLECFFNVNSWSTSLYRTASNICDGVFCENIFRKNGSNIKVLSYWKASYKIKLLHLIFMTNLSPIMLINNVDSIVFILFNTSSGFFFHFFLQTRSSLKNAYFIYLWSNYYFVIESIDAFYFFNNVVIGGIWVFKIFEKRVVQIFPINREGLF